MKSVLAFAFLSTLAQPALAGSSLSVLSCSGNGVQARVFYEVKSGQFGDFLGFQAISAQGSFYCFGGCSSLQRNVVGDEIQVSVEDRSLVSPSLDRNLQISVPKSLLRPGAQGPARLTADVLANDDSSKLETVSADLTCTAGEGAPFLLSAKR
jgi:hypothetical protein